MGCVVSSNNTKVGAVGTGTSKDTTENEAEKLLKQAKEEEKYNIKVLLLGAGESGKSTVVKQIKVIWNVATSPDEIRQAVHALQQNVIQAMQTLLHASEQLKVSIKDPSLEHLRDKILALDQNCRANPEIAEQITKLWQDEGIQEIYSRRTEFWHMDATQYYLTECKRIAEVNFEPNDEDMIMARARTTGIVVSEVVEKPYRFQIVDVGGQRSERRKWIHCFDDVKAIIYLASLSGYNQGERFVRHIPSDDGIQL